MPDVCTDNNANYNSRALTIVPNVVIKFLVVQC